MVNKRFICLVVMHLFLMAYGLRAQQQPLEEKLSGIKDCISLETKVLGLIPDYYDQHALDSIEIMLDFVAYKCTESASLRLVRFLLLMEQNRFTDTLLTSQDLYYIKQEVKYLQQGRLYDLEQFMRFQQMHQHQTVAIDENWTREVNQQRISSLLVHWIDSLYARPEQPAIERSILRELMPAQKRADGVPLWHLGTRKHGYLTLDQVYRQYHRNYVLRNAWFFHTGIGFWQPFGQLQQRMGTRLAILIGGGTMIGKSGNAISLSLTATGGSLPQPFRVTNADTSFLSDYPYLWMGHIDFHKKLWQPGRHWYIHGLGGISLVEKGVYQTQTEDPEIDNEPADIINRKMGDPYKSVAALSLGLECSWFAGQRTALHLQTRYLFQNLGNIGGTPFDGHAFQVSLGLRVFWGSGSRRSLNDLLESGGWW